MPANKQIARRKGANGRTADWQRRGMCYKVKVSTSKATAYEPNDKPKPKYTHTYTQLIVDMANRYSSLKGTLCMFVCLCVRVY